MTTTNKETAPNTLPKAPIAIGTPLGARAEKICNSYGDLRASLQGLLVDVLKDCESVDKDGKQSENGSVFGYLVSNDKLPKSYKSAIKEWVQTFSCFTFQGNVPKKDRAKVGQRNKDGIPLFDHAKGSETPFWQMSSEQPPKPFGLAELLKEMEKFRDRLLDISTGKSDTRVLIRKNENKPKLENVAGALDALISKLEANTETPGNVTQADQVKDRAKDDAKRPIKAGGKALHVNLDTVANNPLAMASH